MAESRPQNLQNHVRVDPWYHYVLPVLLLITLTLVLAMVFRRHDILSFALLSGTLSLLIVAAKVRAYPLRAQDRVIRLEERLRLMTILPVLLHHRIPELTESQLIALRFASDTQLMALTARVLEENLDSRQIKAAITDWRPDNYRV